jgi:PIN domain nuclease of toxin-antitoxin system
MAIKVEIGKLPLSEHVDTYVSSRMRRLGAKSLDIVFPHVCQVPTLPLLHRDPFVGVASPLGESNLASTSTDRKDDTSNSR